MEKLMWHVDGTEIDAK